MGSSQAREIFLFVVNLESQFGIPSRECMNNLWLGMWESFEFFRGACSINSPIKIYNLAYASIYYWRVPKYLFLILIMPSSRQSVATSFIESFIGAYQVVISEVVRGRNRNYPSRNSNYTKKLWIYILGSNIDRMGGRIVNTFYISFDGGRRCKRKC